MAGYCLGPAQLLPKGSPEMVVEVAALLCVALAAA